MSKVYVTHVREHKVNDGLKKQLRKTLRPVTIVALHDEAEDAMAFAAARCGKRDHFTKKIGTRIATERSKNKPLLKVFMQPGVNAKAVFLALAPVIARGVCFNCGTEKTVIADELVEAEHV